MQRGNLLILSVTLALTACERGQVMYSAPIDLGATAVRISMDRTGVSAGPARQVCLTMAPNDADSLERVWDHTTPRRLPVHAVLITSEGTSDTLGAGSGVSLLRREPGTICLWDRGLSGAMSAPHETVVDGARAIRAGQRTGPPRTAMYSAILLWSDRPLRVSEVRWWSGEHVGFL